MRYLSLAICSLGVWVALNTVITGDWVDYVFGGLAAVLAFVGMMTAKS
ncbi:MAG: hypothetical protein PVJ61_07510 [Dehalococcoidia bacterium]|jgi:hypothetical protein